ncbi:HAD hydrolase-like protein [Actinomadura sp. 7K534]|uniref:HAD family hydrolase n=1 Tax=Actinomadura sp. 7K534 TaxID=2530366 RepID=UPI00104B40A9|nr:HAD hydrolase-like protein [Actinomadura sp. 7K534]TDB93927.1 HAD family hydrolase [Actinomadura sp. 7K534]
MRPANGAERPGVLAFDWNGTLVDDAGRAHRATNRVLREHGLAPLTEPEFRTAFTLPMRRFFITLGVAERWSSAVEERWNEEMAAETAPLSTGASEILRAAADSGVRVVVVSAAASHPILRDARRLGVEHLLADVVASAEDKASALSRLVSGAPGPVMYVGDSEYDMGAALAAGAYPVGFGRGYRPAEALADAGAEIVVWNLAALTAFLTWTRSPGR